LEFLSNRSQCDEASRVIYHPIVSLYNKTSDTPGPYIDHLLGF